MTCYTRKWATASSFCHALFRRPSPASPGWMAPTSPSSGTAMRTTLTATVNTKVSGREENKEMEKRRKVELWWLIRWCLPPDQSSSSRHSPICVLFPGHSVLYATTAALNISQLTTEHSANYSVYINEDIYCGSVMLVVIGEWDGLRYATSLLSACC